MQTWVWFRGKASEMDPKYWENGVLGTRTEHQLRREQAQRDARVQEERERELAARSKDQGGLDGSSLATGLFLGVARGRQIEREEQARKRKAQMQQTEWLWSVTCSACSKTWQHRSWVGMLSRNLAHIGHEQRRVSCDLCDWQDLVTGSASDANMAKKKHLNDHWKNGECSWWKTDGPSEAFGSIFVCGMLGGIAYGIFELIKWLT